MPSGPTSLVFPGFPQPKGASAQVLDIGWAQAGGRRCAGPSAKGILEKIRGGRRCAPALSFHNRPTTIERGNNGHDISDHQGRGVHKARHVRHRLRFRLRHLVHRPRFLQANRARGEDPPEPRRVPEARQEATEINALRETNALVREETPAEPACLPSRQP